MIWGGLRGNILVCGTCITLSGWRWGELGLSLVEVSPKGVTHSKFRRRFTCSVPPKLP